MQPNPVLAEIVRGDAVESIHRGACAVLSHTGEVVFAAGDVQRPVFPRSAIKPLQALALLESGAAARYRLGDAQIALACASHGGESMHVERVRAWLGALSLGAQDLRCGVHPPFYKPAADALLLAGESPTPEHNNCSGKHAGFLTLGRHLGVSLDDYLDFGHATQAAWRETLGELADDDLAARPRGVDGCGIPVVGLPLRNMALALARFARPQALGRARREAALRVHQALAAHPEMIAGSGRLCTAVIRLSGGTALIKTGAEGVYAAALPGQGLGIALKIDDGQTRAAECAVVQLLHRFGAFSEPVWQEVQALAMPRLRNVAGAPVGRIQAGPALRESV